VGIAARVFAGRSAAGPAAAVGAVALAAHLQPPLRLPGAVSDFLPFCTAGELFQAAVIWCI